MQQPDEAHVASLRGKIWMKPYKGAGCRLGGAAKMAAACTAANATSHSALGASRAADHAVTKRCVNTADTSVFVGMCSGLSHTEVQKGEMESNRRVKACVQSALLR